MNRVPIPDNLHFYQKNDNNILSVNLSLTGDQSVGLDYSKSIGQSEVALTLLGLPREEMRQVLYEDVPSYGFDRGRWNAIVRWNLYNVHYYDINSGGQASVIRRLKNRKVDIVAGADQQYDPDALNWPCGSDGLPNKSKYYKEKTFAPVIYQDAENTSITMESWPSKGHLNTRVPDPCNNPTKYFPLPNYEGNYYTRLESKETYRYEPGKILGMTFGVTTSVEGVTGKNGMLKTVTWGAENNTDSYYFKLKGDQFFVGRRSIYTQNNVEISRSGFIDPLDGRGKSGAKIDFSKVTMYALEYSWYGAIGCTFYVYLPYGEKDTKWIKLADLPASNTFSVPALADPYMRMFMEMDVPHGVPMPHFFRKHGTSVYVDGGSVDKKKVFSKNAGLYTPVKLTTGDVNEGRNVLSVKISEKNSNAATDQFNKTKIFPIDIQAFFNSSVYLDIEVTTAPTFNSNYLLPSHLYRDGSVPNRNITYPIKVWEAKRPLANALYFSDFNKGYVRPSDGPPDGSSYSGASGQFYEDYYDYILPLDQDILNSGPALGKFRITIPESYNLSEVARSLLNTVPLLYDQSLASRTTLAYYNCFNLFNPWVQSVGPSYRRHPNWVYGMETLPLVTSVKRVGANVLECECESPIRANSDGIWQTAFDPLTDLNQPTSIYPTYDQIRDGTIPMYKREFGGYKMAPTNWSVYDASTSKVCLKKDFYRNDAFLILNAPFDTGRVIFNYPVVPSSIFCIQKPFVDFLSNENWFKDKQLAFGSSFTDIKDNALSYLLHNSEFRFLSKPSHVLVEELSRVLTYNAPPYFKPTSKFYWNPDSGYRFLKPEYRPLRSEMSMDTFPFQLKYADYKLRLSEGTGSTTTFDEVQTNPGEPFEGGGSVGGKFITPGVISEQRGVVGFEVNRFTFRIRLRPEARINWPNSLSQTEILYGAGQRYLINLEDLQYLNKDGVFTCSTTFYLMFINNLNRLTGCNRITLLPNNKDLTFNVMWLGENHVLGVPPSPPITSSNYVSPYLLMPSCQVAFSFVNGNPPHSNFFTSTPTQNLDFYGVYVDIPKFNDVDFNKILTLEGEFRAVTCLHNQQGPSETLFRDDVAAANTFIIGSSGAPHGPQTPLYFGFSISTGLTGMYSSSMEYPTGMLNIINTPGVERGDGTRTGYDLALALNNIDLYDFYGNKVDNLGTLYSNNISQTPILYTGDDRLVPLTASASLSATKWSNDFENFNRFRAQYNTLNNDNVNTVQSLKKVSYLVLANKKKNITLDSIFGLAKTQILPIKYGNSFPYDAFVTVSVRTAVPGVQAAGMITMNFEETI